MNTQELIPVNPRTELQIAYEQLPPLLPQQALMLNYILDGDNYTEAYRKAGYTSQYAKQAATVLVSRNPLKAHLDYFFHEMAKIVTPEYLINKLVSITERAIDINSPFQNGELAIKAIAELNKMQGNYAQQTVNVNTISASIEDLRNARNEYKKEQ
jgi:phage terminase small subunit